MIHMPIYALELSDRSYKYLRFKDGQGQIEIVSFGEGDIAPGIIERGEVKQPEKLKGVLSEVFSKNGIEFVAFSLPEEKGFLRNIKLQGVKESEIREALEFQLEEHIPFPPAEIVFDFVLAKKEKDHLDVVLMAFPRTLVESYLGVIKEAGALPVLVESELNASIKSLVLTSFGGTSMIMDWGRTKTAFAIAEEGVLKFTSTIPLGVAALNEAVAKSQTVGAAEAEKLIYKEGFLPSAGNKVFQAMAAVATSVLEEAEKYVSFWQTHSESRLPPDKFYIIGGGAKIPGIEGYFKKELNMDVILGDPWVNLKFTYRYVPVVEQTDSVRFATSIGLALLALDREKNI